MNTQLRILFFNEIVCRGLASVCTAYTLISKRMETFYAGKGWKKGTLCIDGMLITSYR